MNPLGEWAWQQYNRRARTVPNTDECRAAWKIHLAAGGTSNMPGTRTAVATVKPPVIVAATSSMDKVSFARHFTKRHRNSLAGQDSLPDDVTFEVEQMYRVFHARLHGLNRYKHEHEPDSMEDSVDRAIDALIENRNFGWKELAGINGLVAVFPDGQIATRIEGRIRHHETIEDATDRLIQAS